ncbi:hydantoinase/oxoprolinase family protein [Gordonia sp. zg691]|uniref:Hydantoinase/oxoprolinase family protein n=1 Tax=Gordonia jinghuaiqii TaxID=2758710 RepID=A0A7D7QXF7_9ACTN|nr:hydantoinase/oxoprolinase family protein [Gordonia jinghuaiqii]MBD0860392.1 hydantoinase/oxoprolinase family protein [Gordonia jinghuaiqii]QMT01228.1 hydantoinase/oxoprolinase family protein [Gordonia jinghuaiqii]
MYTISVDTGGTFTDVVVADSAGHIWLAKALTTKERAFLAIENALGVIAPKLDLTVDALLGMTTRFNYGTTRSTNAVVEGTAARTAFFTTAGFPDILLLREGGKPDPFRPLPYGKPYVPRHLTFEIDERMDAEATAFRPLDEDSVKTAIDGALAQGAEAIGVCLLWSVANPTHEIRVGELIAEHAPGTPFTLSHQLNPVVREYRRASATVLDASLKPLMQQFFADLEGDLNGAGFAGNLFISTSYGGSWSPEDIAGRPIYSIGSGPSMAPVSAVHDADLDLPGGSAAHDLLVADTGGTTFDVGLVRAGHIQHTNETWLGGRWIGNITGTRAVDVRSIGSGGGSIAWLDSGGLLRVGPRSAGSAPGPVCYGLGGTEPTVTDAAFVLGYLDSTNFMDGTLALDLDAARETYRQLGERIGMTTEQAAHAALTIAADNIVTAIRETTIARGVDPREVTIVAGGGGSGMNIGRIAGELGTRHVLLPKTAGAMSACGALFSDVISEFTSVAYSTTADFDPVPVNARLAEVRAQAEEFLTGMGDLAADSSIEYFVEARYKQQAWELTVALPYGDLGPGDGKMLEEAFHEVHERIFGVREPGQYLELLSWSARATARLPKPTLRADDAGRSTVPTPIRTGRSYFGDIGWVATSFYDGPALPLEAVISGPAVVQEPTTTLVVYPGQQATVTRNGNYLIDTAAGTAAGTAFDADKEN